MKASTLLGVSVLVAGTLPVNPSVVNIDLEGGGGFTLSRHGGPASEPGRDQGQVPLEQDRPVPLRIMGGIA
jgi:hypothetical protein